MNVIFMPFFVYKNKASILKVRSTLYKRTSYYEDIFLFGFVGGLQKERHSNIFWATRAEQLRHGCVPRCDGEQTGFTIQSSPVRSPGAAVETSF